VPQTSILRLGRFLCAISSVRFFLRKAGRVATSSAIIWPNRLARTTVDILDALYRELKSKAAREKRSVKELILRAVEVELRARSRKRSRRVVLPFVPSKAPGTLDIDNGKISSSFLFPDINVGLAVSYGRQVHYSIAQLWLEGLDANARVCFCRFTQIGLLRLLTTEAVMGGEQTLGAGTTVGWRTTVSCS
jgi:hypothetical protein